MGDFMTDAIDDYLLALRRTRASGGSVRERGHYGALQNLLNSFGATLKPKVHCISELANAGAGSPDFGLFTAPQLVFDADEGVRAIRPPDRGVVEAKAPDSPIERVVASEQVAQYWEQYRLVLVTNFRSFVVIGEDEFGRRVTREQFDLAHDEQSFWALTAGPSRLPADIRLRFREFLHRLLLLHATLTQPRDVALMLASLARDCRARLEAAAAQDKARARQPSLLETGGRASPLVDRLDDVRETLEAALGIRFDTDRGMHFFWSTLVQTLFYGIFSGWVIWARQPGPRDKRGGFSPLRVAWILRLRVIRALFEQVYRPGALEGLGIGDVLDWACDLLRRVDDTAFFSRFREDRAVQYFYEPFLEAYDPDLRKDLGVWYTPPEVVDYMVARVDWALRNQLGIERGLADTRVHVLDPCCGTGSFFLAILDRIHKTLLAEGEGDMAGVQVKQAAMERIHGFEIMPAPLVVAHLQVALALEHLYRAPLTVSDGHSSRPDQFPSIMLTNALTGLDEKWSVSPTLPLPELADDSYFAGRVKREEEIWVVIGNPPYNGFAGVEVTPEEKGLTDAWRTVRTVRPPEGKGLNDLYARFWRMAERRIAERTGFGVVCLITNYSWLDGLSYTGMRESFLDQFDNIWIDCLNGDKFKTGKKTPDGKPDPSIFSTRENPEGIGVGTAIGLCVRNHTPSTGQPYRARLHFRHLWGRDKREQLAASAEGDGVEYYEVLAPSLPLGLPFMPGEMGAEYSGWPSLPELMPLYWPGVKTSRDDFLVDIDKEQLQGRIKEYFDPALTDDAMMALHPSIMTSGSRDDAVEIRKILRARGADEHAIVRYQYRPFDMRWLYWEKEEKLLDEKRLEFGRVDLGNTYILECRAKQAKDVFDRGYVTTQLPDNFGNGQSSYFPLTCKVKNHSTLLIEPQQNEYEYNLSASAQAYAEKYGAAADDIFFHIVGILNTPSYRRENVDSLRQSWPRIPLPDDAALLSRSVSLGRRVTSLLDMSAPVDGVTRGSRTAPLSPLLSLVGQPKSQTLDGGLNGRVQARWGYRGQNNTCMPGPGDARARAWTPAEQATISAAAADLGLSPDLALSLLGDG